MPLRTPLAATLARGGGSRVVAVVVLIPFLIRYNSISTSDYSTAKGEQRTVTLADGSTVSLNTATRLRVLYSQGKRSVEMIEGEALFAVAKDPDRPFGVYARRGVATDVGTEFDVRVDGLTVAVSVLEGTVAVAADQAARDTATVAVTTGYRVSYSDNGSMSAPGPADVTRIRGWLSQRIVFNDVTLAAALEEYNRYTAIPVVLGNPETRGPPHQRGFPYRRRGRVSGRTPTRAAPEGHEIGNPDAVDPPLVSRDMHSVAPLALGPVHGEIGDGEQQRQRAHRAVLCGHSDTDGRGHRFLRGDCQTHSGD